VTHPAVEAAHALGESLLRPHAERVDVEGVPRSHIDALAAAGLLGVTAPEEFGGSDCSLAVMREITEELAAADASTWFVWTQHHTPVRTIARGSNLELRSRLLPSLASGASLAGVAFTHLRRPGPPAVEATRDGAGWRLSGDIAWLTSSELADVFLVGAQAGLDVVWVAVPLRGRPQVQARPLALAAMGGTSTVGVRLDGLRVNESDVVLVESLDEWRSVDAARTSDVSPSVLGVAAEAARRLAERPDPASQELAATVTARLDELRRTAYALMDDETGAVEQRLRLRAQAHELAVQVTAGLVAAGAGRSMLLDQPAQRLARVALFLQVQGQAAPAREATLRRLSRVVSSGSLDG
jgi:alkylation response protein AidB-like acyl-CoA dehydrogenase